jgi:hypothetical protein
VTTVRRCELVHQARDARGRLFRHAALLAGRSQPRSCEATWDVPRPAHRRGDADREAQGERAKNPLSSHGVFAGPLWALSRLRAPPAIAIADLPGMAPAPAALSRAPARALDAAAHRPSLPAPGRSAGGKHWPSARISSPGSRAAGIGATRRSSRGRSRRLAGQPGLRRRAPVRGRAPRPRPALRADHPLGRGDGHGRRPSMPPPCRG